MPQFIDRLFRRSKHRLSTARVILGLLSAGVTFAQPNNSKDGLLVPTAAIGQNYHTAVNSVEGNVTALKALSKKYYKDNSLGLEVRMPQKDDVDIDAIAGILIQFDEGVRKSIRLIVFMDKEGDDIIKNIPGSAFDAAGFHYDHQIFIRLDAQNYGNKKKIDDILAHETTHEWQDFVLDEVLRELEKNWPAGHSPSTFEATAQTMKQLDEQIDELAAELKTWNKELETKIDARDAEINEQARKNDADLIVLQARENELQTMSAELEARANEKEGLAQLAARKKNIEQLQEIVAAMHTARKQHTYEIDAKIRAVNDLSAQRSTGYADRGEKIKALIDRRNALANPEMWVTIYASRSITEDVPETIACILKNPQKYAILLRGKYGPIFRKKLELCRQYHIITQKATDLVLELEQQEISKEAKAQTDPIVK